MVIGTTRVSTSFLLLCIAGQCLADLVASTLPSSRSVQVNGTATAFATVINTGQVDGSQCRIELGSAINAGFFYQTTDPTTNQPTGTQDTPVNITAGGSQSFVFGVTPTAALDPQHVQLSFVCDNVGPTASVDGLSSLFLSASVTPVADVIGIALTPSSDGVLTLPTDATFGAFAVATVNVGAAADLTVTGRATFSLDGSILLCETIPTTGACLAAPAASVPVNIAQNGTNTFSVFVASNLEVPADFAARRVFLEIGDASGQVRGSTSVAVTRAAAGVDADFRAPAAIATALELTRSVSWAELSGAPGDLQRFSMAAAGTSDIVVLTDTTVNVATDLALDTGMASETSISNDRLLRSMFKFIDNGDGTFRIVSTKHANYALDADSTRSMLILRDVRSGALDTTAAGYLAFASVAGSPAVLMATGRKMLENGTFGDDYVDDPNWTTMQVAVAGGNLTLTSAAGTSMTLYAPPINLDIPFDLNPDEIERVDNPEVSFTVVDDRLADLANQVVEKYAPQLAVAGSDATTLTAATAMLAQIEADLAADGSQLRYPAEFYMAFREGLFTRTLSTAQSSDGVLGQLTVPYVYFTNETDTDGTHHPFMVIVSYGLPDSLALQWDVAKPPGDGLTPEYPTQSVTRHHHREDFMVKVPLRDYGEVESLTENVMVADLGSDDGVTVPTHHNYASVASTGIAIDGVIIYPTFNNSLHVAHVDAELSANGMHAGQGLGMHYHADPHSATGSGLHLYNESDYTNSTHPPMVSIGFDGVAGYGVYRVGDTSSDGVGVALDEFGGHEHGDYNYHYHSFTRAEVTDTGQGPNDPPGGVPYTAHILPPLGAWAGRINDVPEFWKTRAPQVKSARSVYLGTE